MNPLKVKATGSPITSANISGLQTMTDAEVKNYIANVITEKFAAVTNGTGTAEINITTDNSGSGTSIGSFVDTNRTESIGTHPATGNTTTTTYYAKQVTAAASESITNRPLAWDSHLEEMSDGDIDGVLDLCIEAMVAESSYTAGQYKLQASAPSGGTWVSRYTLTDTAQGGNTVTYLWQKTVASSSPNSDYTPLRSYNGSNCKQMTESEIEQLLPNFRNRIIDTGIGTYKLQSSAPSGGTWVQMGNEFSDTREQVSPQNYAGNYSGNFTGNYTGNYTGPITYSAPYSVSGNYSSNFTGNYQSPVNYTGNYSAIIPGSPTPGPSYTGVYSGNYAGSPTPYSGPTYAAPPSPGPSYTGYFTGYYTTGSPTFYNGIYSGSRNYAGTYAGAPVNYLGPSDNNYAGFFAGTESYTGYYEGGVEPGTFQYYTGYFAGIIPGGFFAGSYQGAPTPQSFTGYFQGPDLAPGEPGDTYEGYFAGIGPSYYTGFYSGGPQPTTYTGYFLGPAPAGPPYTGFYSGPAFYTGYFTGLENYSGPAFYSGSRNYAGNYEGPGYSGLVYYSGTYAGYFSGSSIPGGNYTATFVGVTNYTGFYSGFYTDIIPGSPTPGPNYTGYYSGTANYTGYYTGYFAGVGTAYTGYYTGTTNYSGNYSGSYINTFTGNYSGATIQATKDTVSTIKLWIRTA